MKNIDSSIEIEFVSCAFHLEGIEISQTQIANLVHSSIDSDKLSDIDRSIAEQIAALRTIRALVQSSGKEAMLTPEFLLNLRNPFGNGELRKSSGDSRRKIKPAPPEHLMARLQSACFWFAAESFLELNPVEQAAIVLLRLIEIQPFEDSNDRTAITAASLFLIRSELPPLIIGRDRVTAYRAAIEESFQSNTKPMVELVAQATEEALTRMITAIASNK